MLPIQILNKDVISIVDMESVIGLVEAIISRRCYNRIEDKRDEAVVTYIVSIQTDRRLYAMNSKYALNKLWDEIRSSKPITDFVIESTNELILRLSVSDAWIHVTKSVWQSISSSYSENSCMDTDTLTEIYPDPDFSISTLTANPWFVFLQLLALATLKLVDQ